MSLAKGEVGKAGAKRSVLRLGLFSLAALAVLPLAAGELAIAKEALRDGLWEVARMHAAKARGAEAKLVILESYARERKWEQLLGELGPGGDEDDGAAYYRALALVELGRGVEASSVLAGRTFSAKPYSSLVARLRARLAVESGDRASARAILSETLFLDDSDAKMEAAGILLTCGDSTGAQRLWAEVAADTNASERAATVAAVNLADPDLCRRAYTLAKSPEMRRLAGLRLGTLLIAKDETFDEGAKLVGTLVKDAPDAEGAEAAFTALADRYLELQRFAEAFETYRNTVEIWPEAAKSVAVNEGRGWALLKLGRYDEALEAFVRAEEVATDDEARAQAVLEQGDTLSEAGRGAESLERYRLVLERFPATAAGRRLEGLVKMRELESKGRDLFKAYRFVEAKEVFKSLAEQVPSRKARADYYIALCLYGEGRDADACRLARSLADGTEDPAIRAEATLWLAKHSYNRGNWREAHDGFAAYATNSVASAAKAAAAELWSVRAAFAGNDFQLAVQTATDLAARFPGSPESASGYLIQGESLVELARFDEAVLVLERAALATELPAEERLRAQLLRADALFAMGADNTVRYREALDTYRAVLLGEALTPGMRLAVSFKIGRTLEKLKKTDDAVNQYYTEVVLAYRNAAPEVRAEFDDEARAAFVRAAFRLADEYESRGRDQQAERILELVVKSGVPAAEEARSRIDRIHKKGKFL